MDIVKDTQFPDLKFENPGPTFCIDTIDLTEDIEDCIIACDDWEAVYKRSLAVRELFPSLSDDSNWTGKWLLKAESCPDLKEVRDIGRVELYTDEVIDWDNWNFALNLALRKIGKMEILLEKLRENIEKNRVPKKRPLCMPSTKGECTRCLHKLNLNLIDGSYHTPLCGGQKRLKRFHPYVKSP
jgi:hypothetical protein